ncbi:TPA: hypothetical protein JBJ82_04315 [Legionella pneumophila]|uniref:Uncharacterized protein n=1 Tax=Legionella pneumophila subsp. pneumophila TaxID=91891 RepID=A0AAV2UYL1_LEGPN|nr:conserved protein of unknown function [Legionella pneumophila subsp. pneumophila]HAT6333190.1 hypothetical protein [Legionella pneumophila]HAT8692322.1 hypothetical protein [Legionella pneumophila]HAT8710959.1 hypothetical protein [Legionella pneumophila]HAT8736013.1 hypothetical protein [Legionella pneumophila]
MLKNYHQFFCGLPLSVYAGTTDVMYQDSKEFWQGNARKQATTNIVSWHSPYCIKSYLITLRGSEEC